MKRILLFLAVAFIFGSVMPMMAQQRKAAPQRRATTTSAVPVIQRDHMEFLGLKMGGDVKAFEKALRQKGFADGWGSVMIRLKHFLEAMSMGCCLRFV